VMEYWSNGLADSIFHYSSTPLLHCIAAFWSSLTRITNCHQ
jgi:hypothetical protein